MFSLGWSSLIHGYDDVSNENDAGNQQQNQTNQKRLQTKQSKIPINWLKMERH